MKILGNNNLLKSVTNIELLCDSLESLASAPLNTCTSLPLSDVVAKGLWDLETYAIRLYIS